MTTFNDKWSCSQSPWWWSHVQDNVTRAKKKIRLVTRRKITKEAKKKARGKRNQDQQNNKRTSYTYCQLCGHTTSKYWKLHPCWGQKMEERQKKTRWQKENHAHLEEMQIHRPLNLFFLTVKKTNEKLKIT